MHLVGSKDIVDVDMDLVELYPKLSAQIVIENLCQVRQHIVYYTPIERIWSVGIVLLSHFTRPEFIFVLVENLIL